MALYRIRYGMGGGFGGCGNWEEIEADNLSDAESLAYELVCEEYDSYAGLHGILSVKEIMEEEGCNEEKALEFYNDDRESWIEYEVEVKYE